MVWMWLWGGGVGGVRGKGDLDAGILYHLRGQLRKGRTEGTALRPTGWYSETTGLAFGRWTGWDRSIGHSANRTCPDLPMFPMRSPAAL